MKKILSVLLLVFILCGCNVKNGAYIDEVNEVLNNFYQQEKYKIDYNHKQYKNYENNIDYAYDLYYDYNENDPFVIKMNKNYSSNTVYYFYKEYVLYSSNSLPDIYGVWDDQETLDDFIGLPKFDFSTLKYDISKKELDGEIQYTILFKDDSKIKVIKQINGEDVENIQTNVEIIIKVDLESNNLIEYNFFIEIGDKKTINVKSSYYRKIIYLDENYDIHFPNKVIEKVNQLIKDKQPKEPIVYPIPEDGVVSMYNLDAIDLFYDDVNNYLIVQKINQIDLFYKDNLLFKTYFPYHSREITSISVGNSNMAIAFGDKTYRVQYLNDFSSSYTYTQTVVKDIAILGETVMYTDSDRNSIIYSIDRSTWMEKQSEIIYYPQLTINYKDNILYINSGHESNPIVYLYNIDTFKLMYKVTINGVVEEGEKLYFDGKYIHYAGSTLNPITGAIISKTGLNEKYPEIPNTTLKKTLRESSDFAFITDTEGKIHIYDKNKKSFVYHYYFPTNLILDLGDGRYTGFDRESGKVIIFDTNKIIK